MTLIELLMVIGIVLILSGMILGGLSLIRKQQRKATTLNLMNSLSQALDAYINDYGFLGDARDADSSQFTSKPWVFLGVRRIASGKQPYLDLREKDLLMDSGGSWVKPATLSEGERIADAFGNPLIFTVENGRARNAAANTYTHPKSIRIQTTAGTPNSPTDDFILAFSSTTSAWSRIQ